MGVYYFLILTLGVFIRLVWIGKVEGFHNVPRKGRILIASNHQSWLDCFFLGDVLNRRLYYLVGEHVYKNKIAAWGVNQMGSIKVDRNVDDKSDVYRQSHELLAAGKAVVVFPEGRMTRDGKTQRAYKGVARMALATETDIVPVAIESYHVYSVHHSRPRFGQRVGIKFLEPLRYEDFKELDAGEIVHDLLMPRIAEALGHEYQHEDLARVPVLDPDVQMLQAEVQPEVAS